MPLNATADPARPAVEDARGRLARLAEQTDLPLPEAFRRVCEAAADGLGVERTGVWLLVNGDKVLRCVNLFERSKRWHTKGACLAATDFPSYMRAVSSAPVVACENALTDARTAELRDGYLAPLGITSVLDAPLVRDGRVVGVMCHEHVGPPRGWTEEERAFAREVADLAVDRIKAAEGALRSSPPGAGLSGKFRAVRPSGPAPQPDADRPAGGAGPGHEFRNLLAEILANAELLARTPGLPPAGADRLARITAAATRGVALLRDLLASAGRPPEPDTGEHRPLDPRGEGL